MTQNAAIIAGSGAGVDGSVNILVAGDYTANSTNADTTAGQGAGNLGSVTLSAANVQTVAGANITGNDVFLKSNSNGGGDFDLAGAVTATKSGGTTGIISLTQNGSTTVDISDNDVTGGLSAQQINLTNNATGGTISILNNGTAINFKDVTANAVADITLVEQVGGGRDGSINFTGNSVSGAGTFTVLADQNIYSSSSALISGVNGDFRSNGAGGVGNIGQDQSNSLNINFTGDVRIQALGGPTTAAGNAFLASNGDLNFGGANSQVTGLLYVTTDGNITTSPTTTVLANTADLFSVNGSIGNTFLSPFNLDAGTGAGQGVTAVALNGDVAIFDANDSKIGYGSPIPNSIRQRAISRLCQVGNLFVTENVDGSDVILAANNNINLGAGNSHSESW